MIIVLKPDLDIDSREYRRIESHINNFQNVEILVHNIQGKQQLLTELYLIGNTAALSLDEMKPS